MSESKPKLVELDYDEIKLIISKLEGVNSEERDRKIAKAICSKFGTKEQFNIVPFGNKMLLAKELYEICCYPRPTKYEEISQYEKDVWEIKVSIIYDIIETKEQGEKVDLDEDKLMDLLIEYDREQYPGDWENPNEEKIRMICANKDIVKIICSKFSIPKQRELPSVTDIEIVIDRIIAHCKSMPKEYEAIQWFPKNTLATAIHDMLKGVK